jgi:hypothetical protein
MSQKTTNTATAPKPETTSPVKQKVMSAESVSNYAQTNLGEKNSQLSATLWNAQNETIPQKSSGAPINSTDETTDNDPQTYSELVSYLQRKLKGSSNEILFNNITSEEAIDAYRKVEKFSKDDRVKLNEEYPQLVDKMLGNLPASFIENVDIGFVKGISSEVEEFGEPSGEERMLDLLKDKSTWENPELLEMVLSILGQNSESRLKASKYISSQPEFGNSELVKKYIDLKNYQTDDSFPETEEAKGGKYITSYFSKNAYDDEIERKDRRNGMALHFMGLKKSDSSVEGLKLDKLQEAGGGHFTGFKFSGEDKAKGSETNGQEGQKDDSFSKWLGDKGVDTEKLTFKEKDFDKLDQGAISFQADLKGGNAHLLAASLPYERIDYIAPDYTFRGGNGAFRKLYLEAGWEPLQKVNEKKDEWKEKKKGITPVAIKLLLGEAEMNQLRYIEEKETYGFGKILVNDIELNYTLEVPTDILYRGTLGKFIFGLLDILTNAGSLLSSISNIIISKVASSGHDEAINGFREIMADGFYRKIDFDLKFQSFSITNVLTTEMGLLGDFQANNETGLSVKSINNQEFNNKNLISEKNSLKELEDDLEDLKEKRDKTKDEGKLETINSEIKRIEAEIKKNSYFLKESQQDEYKVTLTLENTFLDNLAIFPNIVNGLLTGDITSGSSQESGILDSVEIDVGNIVLNSTISGNGMKDTSIDIDYLKLSTQFNNTFEYKYKNKDTKKEYTLSGTKPVIAPIILDKLHISFKNSYYLQELIKEDPVGKKSLSLIQQNQDFYPSSQSVDPVVDSYIKNNSAKVEKSQDICEVSPIKSGTLQSLFVPYISFPSVKLIETEGNREIAQLGETIITTFLSEGITFQNDAINIPNAGFEDLFISSFIITKKDKNNKEQKYQNEGKVNLHSVGAKDVYNADLSKGKNGLGDNFKVEAESFKMPKFKFLMSYLSGITTGNIKINKTHDGLDYSIQDVGANELTYQDPKNDGTNIAHNYTKANVTNKAEVYGSIKDNGEKEINFVLENGTINLPRIWYDDSNGNEIKTSDVNNLSIVNPIVSVLLPPFNKETGKLDYIKIQSLFISQIKTKGWVNIDTESFKLYKPAGREIELNRINMFDLKLDLLEKSIHGYMEFGKTNLETSYIELKKGLGNIFKANPNLHWDRLTFEGSSEGAFTVGAENTNLGLNYDKSFARGKPGFDDTIKFLSDSGLEIRDSDPINDSNLIQAERIKYSQYPLDDGKSGFCMTLKNPKIGKLALSGKNSSKIGDFSFQDITLQGGTEGELEISKSEFGFSVNGLQNFSIEKGRVNFKPNKKDNNSKQSGSALNSEQSGKTKLPDKKNNEISSKDSKRPGYYDLFEAARGYVKIELFDEYAFSLAVKSIINPNTGKKEYGFVNLDVFIEGLITCLRKQFKNLFVKAVLKHTKLNTDIDDDEIAKYYVEIFRYDAYELIPDAKNHVFNASEVLGPGRKGEVIRLSALIENLTTIGKDVEEKAWEPGLVLEIAYKWILPLYEHMLDEERVEFLTKIYEGDRKTLELIQGLAINKGLSLLKYELIEMLMDEKKPMNPKVTLNAGFDFSNRDLAKGPLSFIQGEGIKPFEISAQFAEYDKRGIESDIKLEIKDVELPYINYPFGKNGEGNVSMDKFSVKKINGTYSEESSVNLEGIKLENFNLYIPFNTKESSEKSIEDADITDEAKTKTNK